MHCQKQILMSTSTWCRKTCQASSHPFLRSDSIRLFKYLSIVMIKLLAFAVHRNGPCTKSSQIIDAVCFKGKWRRQTRIPRIFREQDLRHLLDFVIDNSHFEINGYLFRQERGVAMGSPAAPPLCNLVATVEDFFWHQTMISLRFSHARHWCNLA